MKILNNKYYSIFKLLSSLAVFASLVYAADNQQTTMIDASQMSLMDQEIRYEKDKAEYLQEFILDKILGPGKAVVIVDMELGIESKVTKQTAQENKTEKKKHLNDMDYILPGVPNPKSVTDEKAPAESKEESGQAAKTSVEIKTSLKKQIVTVLHDEKVTKDKLDIVRDAIIAALKIDIARGDKVEFKKTKFTLGFWDRVLEPYFLIPTAIALLLLFFLYGPLSSFFSSYVRTLREKGGTEVTVDSKFEGMPGEEEGADGKGGGGGGGGVGELGLEKEKEKYIPFKYINDENLKRLIYLIRKEPPKTIALVVSYLKPEYVKEILKSFAGDLQAKVAVEMATIRSMKQDQVMVVDNDIKEKIDFLIGGLDHLLKVLDQVDKTTNDNIMDYLRNEKPELYERVKKFIITFDDIPTFPDQALQTIIREIRSENLARALREVSPDILNKFFANMSANAVAVLKEEMEYGRPLSKDEIEEERKKIVDAIKNLENSGKVFIREKPKNMFLEGAQDLGGPAEAPAFDENAFNEYFNAGVGFYDQSQFEEAVNYFEYCAQLNPNNASVLQYLGNSYYSLGRMEAAILNFEKVLEINPDDTALKAWVNEQKGILK